MLIVLINCSHTRNNVEHAETTLSFLAAIGRLGGLAKFEPA